MAIIPLMMKSYRFRLTSAATGFILLSAFSIHSIDRLKYPLYAFSKQGLVGVALLSEAARLVTLGDVLLGSTALLILALVAVLEFRDGRLSEAILQSPTRHFAILVLGLSLWFVHGYLNPGFLLSGDAGSHIARTAHVHMGLSEGRFIHWDNYFYFGSAFLQFTGPLYFWVTGLIDVVIGDPDLTNKLFLAMLHFLSGAFFFGFMREKGLGRFPALVGALAYGGAFAHIHLILWKGAYPQAITMTLLPLAFWLSERVLTGTKVSPAEWAGLTLTNSLLIINHQATGMFAGIFLAMYLSVGFMMNSYRWSKLLPLVISGGIAILISLFAVVPILLERQYVMMYGSPEMFHWLWPDMEYFKNLLSWRNVGVGFGTSSEAYVGLSVFLLALLGLGRSLTAPSSHERLRNLVFASAIGLLFSLFLRGPHVRDIVFTLFFLAVLAAVGANAILETGWLGKRAPALLLTILLVDIGSTAVQPIARTDKDYFRLGAAYLSQTSPTERVLQSYSGGKAISLSIGPSGSPLLRYPVQQLIGAHSLEATLGHNFVAAIIKRAEHDLRKMEPLSESTQSLLGTLNVTRLINDTGSGFGFSEAFPGAESEGLLGRVIKITGATPFIFSQRLVEYGPQPDLEKPILWNEHFEEPEHATRIAAINTYLDNTLKIMQRVGAATTAEAIPIRVGQAPSGQDGRLPAEKVKATLVTYRVGIDRIILTLQSSHAGYAQLSHPWYPFMIVTRNGQRIEPLRSSLDMMVVTVEPGTNVYQITPRRSLNRVMMGWFCFVVFLVVFGFGVIGHMMYRKRMATGKA